MNAATLVAMARTVEGYNPDQPRAPRGSTIGGRFISADAVLTLLRSTGQDAVADQVERLATRRSSGASSAGGRLMSAQSLKRGQAAHLVNVAKADKLRASIRRDEERLSARKSAGDPLLNPGAAKDFHATLRRKRDELAELDADIAGYKAMLTDHDRTFGGKPAGGAAEKLARAKVAELAGVTPPKEPKRGVPKAPPQRSPMAEANDVVIAPFEASIKDIEDANARTAGRGGFDSAADRSERAMWAGRQERELRDIADRQRDPGESARFNQLADRAALAAQKAESLPVGATIDPIPSQRPAPKVQRTPAPDLPSEVADRIRTGYADRIDGVERSIAAAREQGFFSGGSKAAQLGEIKRVETDLRELARNSQHAEAERFAELADRAARTAQAVETVPDVHSKLQADKQARRDAFVAASGEMYERMEAGIKHAPSLAVIREMRAKGWILTGGNGPGMYSWESSDGRRQMSVTLPRVDDAKGAVTFRPRDGKTTYKAAREYVADGQPATQTAGTAVKKVAAAKRAATEPAADVVTKLRAATSREQGSTALKGKTRAELVEIAKAAGVHHPARATKPQIEADLVQWLVGRRLTSDAILGRPEKSVPPQPSEATKVLIARLSALGSRGEVATQLAPVKSDDLRTIAKALNIPNASGLRVPDLRLAIVDATVGLRLDSIATRGFDAVRP